MSLPKINSYEVKESRSGCKVPIINGIHLHSAYDPNKESLALVEKYREQLKTNRNIFILGLGFGYHLDSILNELKKYREDFKIYVIEPNQRVYEDYLQYNKNESDKIKIISGQNIKNIYADLDFVSFLVKKPVMIPHPASFNLYSDYFKELLSYKATNTIHSVAEFITNKELKDYLANAPQLQDLDTFIQKSIKDSGIFSNQNDFLLMAFEQMTRGSMRSKESQI